MFGILVVERSKVLYYVGYDDGYYIFNDKCDGSISGDYFYPSDVTPYDEFVLPKKWAVAIDDESRSVLKEYWLEQPYDHSYSFFNYLLSDSGGDNTGLSYASNESMLSDSITVITFEQFKKHILKQPFMKKLIGYNLKSEYKNMKDAASMIAFGNTGWTYNAPHFDIEERESHIEKLRSAGVLDLWFDKVYEKEVKEETHYLGDKKIEVVFKEDGIYARGEFWKVEDMKMITDSRSIIGYTVNITEFKIGCTTVKVSELTELLGKADKFYNSLK